jgi:hypothetical protein
MTQEAQDSYAQALLVEAELLAATLPGLRERHGEAQAALEQAQASSTEVQIRVRKQAIQRLERVSTLRAHVVQTLRAEGERVLAALCAEEQPGRQQSQA